MLKKLRKRRKNESHLHHLGRNRYRIHNSHKMFPDPGFHTLKIQKKMTD